MKALLAVSVALMMVSAASADMAVEVTQNPDPQPGLKSYTVTFTGDDADDALSAFDGRFDGPMSQTWFWFKAWMTTVWIGDFVLPGEAASEAVDSHMLIDPHDASHVLIASEVDEDFDSGNIIETTVDGYDRALGTYLATSANTTMAFGIPGTYQTSNTPFAQIVIPVGEEVWLTGVAVSHDSTRLVLNELIPEPASLALLGLSGLGMVLRRRRK